jgi:hypothetical protein
LSFGVNGSTNHPRDVYAKACSRTSLRLICSPDLHGVRMICPGEIPSCVQCDIRPSVRRNIPLQEVSIQ